MSESIESNDMSPADKAEFEELRRLLVAGIELLSRSSGTSSPGTTSRKLAFSTLRTRWVWYFTGRKIKQSAIEKLGQGIEAQFSARTKPRTRRQAAQEEFFNAMAIRAAS